MAGSKIKGITIELGAETTQLDSALRDVNKRSRDLQSELRDVERLLKFDPGNVEALTQRQELLSQAVENTSEKLNRLRQVQDQVEEQFANGEISEEQYRAFRREIEFTEASLRNLDRRLNETQSAERDTERTTDKLKSSFKEAGRAAKEMGSTISKSLGGAAIAGGAAIGGLVAGTQDLNMDLAKLRTNAENAGYSLEGVEENFNKIATVSGETDSAVETLSNLMQTNFNDQQLSQVIDEINGAAIRFSDTLKTEGIADGLQETFATGAAIGQFGELLERSGVNLDTFNAGLAEAKKNGSETDYVLQQLSDLGLSKAYEQYKNLNPELVAQQEAQQEMNMALADLSITLTPLVTMIMEFLTMVAEWVNKNIELVQSFGSISEGLEALLPQMAEQGVGILMNIITGIVENLPLLFETAQSLIPVIVQALIVLLPQILETGIQILLSLVQGISNMLPSLIQMALLLITNLVTTLITNLPQIIESGTEILLSLLDGIEGSIPSLISTALSLIILIVGQLVKNLPKIIESGNKIIGALISGIISIAWEIGKAIFTDVIPEIVDSLEDVDLKEIGKDIIRGLISGLGSMGSSIWSTVKSIAGDIKAGFTSFFDINSPSRVMRDDVGKHIGGGLEEGLLQSQTKISRASQALQEAAKPDLSMNTTTTPSSSATFNFEGMFSGANFTVREEADIQKIAKQLNEYIKQSARKGGVIIAN